MASGLGLGGGSWVPGLQVLGVQGLEFRAWVQGYTVKKLSAFWGFEGTGLWVCN